VQRRSVEQRIHELLSAIETAWQLGCWPSVAEYAQEILDLDPANTDAAAYLGAAQRRGRREMLQLVQSLDSFPVLAFLTDSLNRIQWVSRSFAATVGDPVKDGLPDAARFVPAAIIGPYQDRFPRWRQEISVCLAGLHREVEAGNLAPPTLRLIEETLSSDVQLLRAAARSSAEWDGTMVVRDPDGRTFMVREEVLPLLDVSSRPTGFHLTQWFPCESAPAFIQPQDGLASLLTPRQLEIARLYASGMTADDVAATAGISRHTARDHLEEIYNRLDVHSRSELTLRFAREGFV
jgi:DNA-binding CsgD family transcriptional regulator/PAS domain-containing protein